LLYVVHILLPTSRLFGFDQVGIAHEMDLNGFQLHGFPSLVCFKELYISLNSRQSVETEIIKVQSEK
jgi:hypothetical protein